MVGKKLSPSRSNWEFVKSIIGAILGSISGPALPASGVLNKDPTVWLDFRRPPIGLIVCWTNSEIDKLGPYEKKNILKMQRNETILTDRKR